MAADLPQACEASVMRRGERSCHRDIRMRRKRADDLNKLIHHETTILQRFPPGPWLDKHIGIKED
jgi:hypothetical protein